MIRKDRTDLSQARRCKLLKVSGPSIYYSPVGFDQAAIELIQEIGRGGTKYPFFGSRHIAAYSPQPGVFRWAAPRAPLDGYHGTAGHPNSFGRIKKRCMSFLNVSEIEDWLETE